MVKTHPILLLLYLEDFKPPECRLGSHAAALSLWLHTQRLQPWGQRMGNAVTFSLSEGSLASGSRRVLSLPETF